MPEVQPWHINQLLNPEYTRVDLVKEGANSQAHIKLFKQKGGNPMKFEELLTKMKPEHVAIITAEIAKMKSEAEAVLTAVEKAKTDAEEALKVEVNKAKGPSATDTEEEILKSIQDPSVRALIEKQMAKTAVAEAEIRKANKERLDAEAIAKAKEVPAVGASVEQLADIYKGLDAQPELRTTIFEIFKASSAMTAESITFDEIGKSAGGGEIGSTDQAWAQIEKAAKAFETEGLTSAQAVTKAISANPELYKQYLASQR